MTPRIVQRVVARYAEIAQIDHLTPHALRHSFARALIDNGASLVQVAALMGHKGLTTTARYTQPSERELEKVVEM